MPIHFEEPAQCSASVAAAEPVGAECHERRIDVGGDQLRVCAHIVARRYDGAFAGQALAHMTSSWCFLWVQSVPALRKSRFARELAVTRDAPRFRRNAPVGRK